MNLSDKVKQQDPEFYDHIRSLVDAGYTAQQLHQNSVATSAPNSLTSTIVKAVAEEREKESKK